MQDENYKKPDIKRVREFIDAYYNEIDQFMRNGGKMSALIEIIRDETGVELPAVKVSRIRSDLKKKRLSGDGAKPVQPAAPASVTTAATTKPAATYGNNGSGEKRRLTNADLRTSKNFLNVDITDL